MGKLSEDEFNYFDYESLEKLEIFKMGKKLIQDRPETENPLSEKMILLEEKREVIEYFNRETFATFGSRDIRNRDCSEIDKLWEIQEETKLKRKMYDYDDTTPLSEVDFSVEIQARKVYQFISDNAEFETKKGHTLQGKERVKWKESRLTIPGCLQTVCLVHEETGRDRLRIESKSGSRITSYFVDDKSFESFCVTTKKGSNVELNIKRVKDIIEQKEIAKEKERYF